MNPRTRIRLGRALRHGAGVLRGSLTNLLLGIVVVALLVLTTVGVLSPEASLQTTGLLPLLQAQAINALSLALLALVAWLGFRLRYSTAKRRYLGRYRMSADGQEAATPTDRFVRNIAEQLMAARPPHSLLIVTPAGSLSSDLEKLLPAWMVQSGLVPVVIDVEDCDSTARIPALSRTSFVLLLAGASGDEARAQRLFLREADRGKVIVLVRGLDKVVEAQPRTARRATVRALLRSSLDERLPFIAAVSEQLAPRFSDVAVVRIGGRREQDLGAVLTAALARRGIAAGRDVAELAASALSDDASPYDPWYAEVAADVVVGRVRAGDDPDHALRDVVGVERGDVRELSWLYEKAIGSKPDQGGNARRPVADTLGAIGVHAHYRQDLTTRWHDVARAFGVEEELTFASDVALLNRRGVLDVVGDARDPSLQFTHPRWLVLAGAVGFGLDQDRWSQLLTPGVPQPTLEALTAALVLAAADGTTPDPSFLIILRRLKADNVTDLSLDMITAVLRALQASGTPIRLGEQELRALRRTWQPATDEARLLFVDKVDAHRGTARFLWEQLVPPRFEHNTYRLRRAASARLAAMGGVAWGELAPLWNDLVNAADHADLSARARLTKSDWMSWGLPVASLAWVLPSLTDRLADADRADALRMLNELGRILTAGAGPQHECLPDPGLEISLAEGYKLAGAVALSRPPGQQAAWLPEAATLLRCARSWVSEQALHHAVALVGSAESAADASGRHPFVREAIALTHRAVAADVHASDITGRERRAGIALHIWFDDVQALQDGGFALSPEAHRLLGLSTLLINLAEGEHERAVVEHGGSSGAPLSEQVADRVAARERALTSEELPRCFTSPTHTATMLDVECDCPFRLCGQKGQETIGHRHISRAFAQHAEMTAAVRPAAQDGVVLTRRQFAEVWRRPQIVSGADDPES